MYRSEYVEIMFDISDRTGIVAFAIEPLVVLLASRNNILLWITNWSTAPTFCSTAGLAGCSSCRAYFTPSLSSSCIRTVGGTPMNSRNCTGSGALSPQCLPSVSPFLELRGSGETTTSCSLLRILSLLSSSWLGLGATSSNSFLPSAVWKTGSTHALLSGLLTVSCGSCRFPR